ncbi:hypothetical protein FJT64_007279 [Amphibalanus amphitrite]|uniref:Circadian clock-controlled protein n=1 Tax=Amphibalanus amphitrite TaxID=1232801 RepID=A0A6A4VKW9_AMPAM|nr:hypothetical protein FJT64_007279 [Amphibalanus amphitrite]
MRITLLTILSAALLASCTAAPSADPTECDISRPDRLSACIERLLSAAQPLVRWPWLLDPLRLPNQTYGSLETWDAVVLDLSHYEVSSVSAMPLSNSEVAVSVQLQWPEITGAMSARLRKCRRVVFELCASASARPHIFVKETLGVIATILKIDAGPDGRTRVRASDTVVALKPGDLKVKVNLRGLVGAVNNIIGDPASRIATDLTNKWWNNNRPAMEKKLSKALESLVENELTRDLEKLVRLPKA